MEKKGQRTNEMERVGRVEDSEDFKADDDCYRQILL